MSEGSGRDLDCDHRYDERVWMTLTEIRQAGVAVFVAWR